MRQKEIDALAKRLVEYVEQHPNRTRPQIDRAVSPESSTITAWESIKHLFDYDRFATRGAKGVTYKRNAIAYGREIAKRIYTHPQPLPSKHIIELSKKMQLLIDESQGISGEEIRKFMMLKMGTFKLATKLIKADRRRSFVGRGVMDYYPIGFKMPPKPIKEPKPIKVPTQRVNQYRFMVIAKSDLPILTRWSPLGVVPWLEGRV